MTRLDLALWPVALATLVGCNGFGTRVVTTEVSNTLPAEEAEPSGGATIPVIPVITPIMGIVGFPPPVFDPLEAGSDADDADAGIVDAADAGILDAADAGIVDAADAGIVDASPDSDAQALPPPISQSGGVAVGGGCYSIDGDWCDGTGYPSSAGLDRPLICVNPTVDALEGCESVAVPASGNPAGYDFSYWCCTPLRSDAGSE
jgi:hypothetical protein